ncbi:MAG: prepilin-type N-terminal cleavage/methylation domain-containing protein [Sulfurovum sp.]|nr:prepilin-type N-terminal cleavage/methylation domain-containing protein [Sulfurovum sp.]
MSGTKKGFSLIELLLVIFIVSLVYFLGFEGVEKSKKRSASLTPLNLKREIREGIRSGGRATFICINGCRSCYLRESISTSFEPWKGNIDLKGMQVYTVGADDALQKENYGRYRDQKICLVIDFYPNGSSTPLILHRGDESYFLPAYFKEAQKTASLEAARDLWLAHAHNLDGEGDFY